MLGDHGHEITQESPFLVGQLLRQRADRGGGRTVPTAGADPQMPATIVRRLAGDLGT
jgi:hypothetical protein